MAKISKQAASSTKMKAGTDYPGGGTLYVLPLIPAVLAAFAVGGALGGAVEWTRNRFFKKKEPAKVQRGVLVTLMAAAWIPALAAALVPLLGESEINLWSLLPISLAACATGILFTVAWLIGRLPEAEQKKKSKGGILGFLERWLKRSFILAVLFLLAPLIAALAQLVQAFGL